MEITDSDINGADALKLCFAITSVALLHGNVHLPNLLTWPHSCEDLS